MADTTLLIDKTIKKIEYLIRSSGINIKVGKKTRKDRYRSMFMYILNFIWLNTDLLGAMIWFISGVVEHKNFTELTYVAPCVTLSCLANLKAFYIVINEKTADLLIDNMRELEIKQNDRARDPETEKIIKAEHKYLNSVIKVLKIFYIVLILGFASSPLMLVFLNYMATNEVELLLPFLIVYPFDPFDMRYYPWVYLRQIWSEIVVILHICVVDFMFYIFCIYLRMQFRLLRYYIERMIPVESKIGVLPDKEETKLKLVELIQWHQQLISCVDLLDSLYTRSTLFNFVASSVLICLTGFNVMAIDDVAFMLTFLCFLLMSLLQIFFLCFFGDLLIESSMAVGDAIYDSRWYLTDAALGKTLLIILTRAHTPCKLTASNFAEVNLKAFMKVPHLINFSPKMTDCGICSSAWSYFALLQTLYTAPTQE